MPRSPEYTILIVDDEPEILNALGAGLARGLPQARVITASDGQAALERLVDERVDIIISDQNMPRMNGTDFLVAARRLSPSTARMMLTAYPEVPLVERNINDAHVIHFFTKPYRLANVIEVVRQVAERLHRAKEAKLAMAGGIERARRAVVARSDTAPIRGGW